MKPTFLTIILILVTGHAVAAETRTWTGTWNNRKFGTSGPLRCVGEQNQPGQWSAVFTGTFKGDPFEYRAQFQSRIQRQNEVLSGKATIRGSQYEWTGTIRDKQLRGKYNSAVGYYGEFILNETSRSSTPTGNRTAASATPVETAPITDGEKLLFVGNSYMANEGGVFNYLTKALKVGAEINIETEKFIFYGRPLSAMGRPEVRDAITSKKFDRIVITSGQERVMQQYVNDIKSVGLKPIVFMTWQGRHPGNRSSEEQYTAATRRDVETMRSLQRATGATVIPAAVVFHELTLNPPPGMPRIDYLWRAENIHQNELGTMVNAWMCYAILTGNSPAGVNFEMPPYIEGTNLKSEPDLKLTPQLRTALQDRVWQVARAWQEGKSHLE